LNTSLWRLRLPMTMTLWKGLDAELKKNNRSET
jgi:hypothetical protein